jgi:hypothetical protein
VKQVRQLKSKIVASMFTVFYRLNVIFMVVCDVLCLTGASQAAVSQNHGCVMEIMIVQMERMNLLPAVHLISTPVTPRTSNARTTSKLCCVKTTV